jgi:hypothetical protein
MNNQIIFKSILKINPSAKFSVTGADIDTCEIEWFDGTTPISISDIKEKITTVETEIAQEEQARINKKASAKAKLKELGLDDDEIKAITN